MNFWLHNSIWFLLGLMVFPRITLLFFAATPFGWLAWIGWLVAPHLLVAILSLPYWHENPILVVGAWLMAFGGTGGEARIASRNY
jgi:hypothetical protein